MDINRIISLTQKLISFKTITGDIKANTEAINYLIADVKKANLETKVIINNNYPTLLISNFPLKGKSFDIILHGHIDVVAADDQEFISKVDAKKIYGRGSCDMLGGVSVFVELIKNLKKEKNNTKILLILTTDEESGGTHGTEFIIKNEGYRGKFFITAEGEREYLLKYNQKGVLMLKLISHGKGEHSGYTWKGENAITKLFTTYKEIEKLFPENLKDKDHWYTTINLGTIKGGHATNAIPEYAEANIDIRFAHNWTTTADILKAIKEVLKRFKGLEIQEIYKTEIMDTNINNPYLQNLHQISKQVLKTKKNLFFKNHGTNDARFAAQVGIPSVGFGPVGENYHAKGEFIYIDSLKKYYEIIYKLIKQNF